MRGRSPAGLPIELGRELGEPVVPNFKRLSRDDFINFPPPIDARATPLMN